MNAGDNVARLFYGPKTKKKVKLTSKSGLIQKILVYEHPMGALLGSGYITYFNNGSISAPDMIDLKGERIPEGWYTIKIVDEPTKLVVIPENIQ